MTSERMQRRIESLLDEADAAVTADEWALVASKARAVLAIQADNVDAQGFLAMAAANGAEGATPTSMPATGTPAPIPTAALPASFVAGRYHVRRFLGEGGKKKVFLAHDESLDRDVAFALIKTEGLDATGRERIVREAQAMGRMGTHPHVVTIFEIGEEAGAPFVVTELLGGGDVEGLLEQAEGVLPLAKALQVAKDVADGLVFAHAQGIVHRDLKPGNVWLTADGVAKIGDFGLAVNLGRSRLTQHGLMVGTVAYMPPEQALGGAVTPQSDLYSLGAMLYELVTGKPPFQADDPTAVISQHINTPPVAPSWNSEYCPPDLEDLILRLLAKAPAERPASAAEVLTALERIDPEAKSASHSNSSANPLDRLARGVFVGRERELERLRGAFDSAFAGRGSVVMLVGEPGIGKTRTTQELETYARLRGAQVLFGRANESSRAPPYYPWTQIARAYRAQNAEEVRRKEWAPYAVELQRVFAALRDLFPNLPEPPAIESEEAQFQLFDAMSGFVRDISERAPVLLVLDDLHWADRPTLLMLAHIARDLAHSRILVVGTYRDTDLDRTHPLSQTLGELNREQLFTRILLRGLAREEVAAYISAVAHVKPSSGLVARIFEETEGNPFFLGEVVNLLTQEGTLTRAGNASVSDLAIPEGVKEALGRRLDRLSPETNSLLQLAAIAGREFDHGLLVALTGQDDDAVLVLVEEALAGRVIEETDSVGEYRFTHALMQETLAGELSAARQVRLHGRIAEALEQVYGERADANAAELAQHFAESAGLNRAHAQKAAHYSLLAGEQAERSFAWDEARRHYETPLDVLGIEHPALQEVGGALHYGVARCFQGEGLYRHAWPRFVAASRWCAAHDRVEEAARIAIESLSVNANETERRAFAEEMAGAVGALDDLAASAEFDMGRFRWNRTPETDMRFLAAAEQAQQVGDSRLQSLALFRLAERATGDGQLDDAIAQAERGFAIANAAGLGGSFGSEREWRICQPLLLHGNIAALGVEARTALAEVRQRGSQGGPAAYFVAVSIALRGDLAGAMQFLNDELGPNGLESLPMGKSFAFAALSIAGGAQEAQDVLASPVLSHVASAAARDLWEQALLAQRLGKDASVDGLIHRAREATVRTQGAPTWGHAPTQVLNISMVVAELADVIADDAWIAIHLDLLRNAPWYRIGMLSLTIADYSRGVLALRLNLVDEASDWFQRGRALCDEQQLPFGLGRCHQGLAEVAERRGDHALAMEHLDAAGELFSKYGAKLYLDQVLAKKQFLKA